MSQKRLLTSSEYGLLMQELRDIHKILDKLTDNQNPTIPIYTLGSEPQDPVDGQIAIIT